MPRKYDYIHRTEKGLRESGSWFSASIKIIALLVMLGLVFGGAKFACSYFGEAADVAQEEFGPRALLRKYEWFKDAYAQLSAKRVNADRLNDSILDITTTYGADVTKWPRDVRQERAAAKSEFNGIKLSYNRLAAEYNAQMSKMNYRFTNAGMLPEGATDPLPREAILYE